MAEPVTSVHGPVIAALHAAAFGAACWNTAAFPVLLGTPSTFGFLREAGFILARVIAGEAEILTLAVAPEQRRQGIARSLLEEALAEAGRRGATEIFLEVAENNAAARRLYASAGFVQAGVRRDYYGPGASALLLRRNLALA
jgi:ribosomal-protein-alanine N-acetyltransferase